MSLRTPEEVAAQRCKGEYRLIADEHTAELIRERDAEILGEINTLYPAVLTSEALHHIRAIFRRDPPVPEWFTCQWPNPSKTEPGLLRVWEAVCKHMEPKK